MFTDMVYGKAAPKTQSNIYRNALNDKSNINYTLEKIQLFNFKLKDIIPNFLKDAPSK